MYIYHIIHQNYTIHIEFPNTTVTNTAIATTNITATTTTAVTVNSTAGNDTTAEGQRGGGINPYTRVFIKSFVFHPDVPIRIDYEAKRLLSDQLVSFIDTCTKHFIICKYMALYTCSFLLLAQASCIEFFLCESSFFFIIITCIYNCNNVIVELTKETWYIIGYICWYIAWIESFRQL